MAYPLLLVFSLLLVEIAASLIFAYFDFKRLSSGNPAIALCLFLIIFLLQIGIVASTGLQGVILILIGALCWIALGTLGQGNFKLAKPYPRYSPFDKAVLFVSAITFPMLFLIASIINAALVALILYIRKETTKIPVMSTYCASFLLAIVIVASTVGLAVVYL